MRITIDLTEQSLTVDDGGALTNKPLYSDEAFESLSEVWLKVAWNQRYPYTFSWFGRPIIQLPEDLVRVQEVIYRVKPDVIVETGVAHGGSLMFYASLCKAMGHGRVIGVDIQIRPHNRAAIESHELAEYIELIEGSSTASETVEAVRRLLAPGARVMVILDSNHSFSHVFQELEAYAGMVSPGSYVVATDGVTRILTDVPRGKPEWSRDNACEAVARFLEQHSEFTLEQPAWPFNESTLTRNITCWPNAYLRRKDGSA
jgi:cephalosporin hydroxylase